MCFHAIRRHITSHHITSHHITSHHMTSVISHKVTGLACHFMASDPARVVVKHAQAGIFWVIVHRRRAPWFEPAAQTMQRCVVRQATATQLSAPAAQLHSGLTPQPQRASASFRVSPTQPSLRSAGPSLSHPLCNIVRQSVHHKERTTPWW